MTYHSQQGTMGTITIKNITVAPRHTCRYLWLFLSFSLFLAAFLLTGCGAQKTSSQQPVSMAIRPVDVELQEFYEALGGKETLGPAISDRLIEGKWICQYTLSVYMCADTTRSGVDRYRLADLGNRLDIKKFIGDHLPALPEQPGQHVIDGVPLYSDFLPLYNTLFGGMFTGKPLSSPIYDQSNNRIVQYFETVAFARDLDKPDSKPYLLPLGDEACGNICGQPTEAGAAVIQGTQTLFSNAIEYMNGFDLVGKALTLPFPTGDGMIMQIYENLVFCAPADNLADAKPCPVSRIVGMYSMEPELKRYDAPFYPVEGARGFHVPREFDEFVSTHGSLTYSGNPLAETVTEDQVHYIQCFENYCLEYNRELPSKGVYLVPLGVRYLEKLIKEGEIDPAVLVGSYLSSNSVVLLVKADKPQLSAGETQTIYAAVFRKDMKTPVRDVNSTVVITLPDGKQLSYDLDATDEQGYTAVDIPAIQGLENGTVVAYQVCLKILADTAVCNSGSYLIWSNVK